MTAKLISPDLDVSPWYRQAWPWGLILGPLSVVVASFFSAFLAVKTADPLVVDDYYKQGLAINQSLGRDRVAANMQLSANIDFGTTGNVSVTLKSAQGTKWPSSLELLLAHPSKDEKDRRLVLLPSTINATTATYRVVAPPLDKVAYHVVLHDVDKQWQLAGRFDVKNPQTLNLTPVTGAGRPADD